jgi:rod shape-determining protein MreC
MPRRRGVTPAPADGAAPGRIGGVPRARGRAARRNAACYALCLLTALALVSLDASYPDHPTPLSPARAVLATALTPATSVGSRGADAVSGYAQALVRPGQAAAEQDRLRAENARLRAEASGGADATAVDSQLRDLLEHSGGFGLSVVPARVVAYGSVQGFQRTVTLDHGSADGVETGAAVITGDGLVGRVLVAETASATVLLLCDARSAVGVRVGSGRSLALARGTGDCGGGVSVSQLATDPKIEAGATVTTTGSLPDGPFPPGLPVGQVIPSAGETGSPVVDGSGVVRVRLSASPGSLDVVGVVRR